MLLSLRTMSTTVETKRREDRDAARENRGATTSLKPQTRHWTRQFAWPALLALLGAAALSVDIPLAQWLRAKGLPGGLNKLCQLSEVWGHGLGAAAILLAAWALAPQQRIKLPRMIGCTYLAGLGADIVKLFLARARPHTIGRSAEIRVFDTFHGWFPFLTNGSGWQSFPSSHTAVAVGLAMGLSWLFPRGKWLFAAFAVLAGAQRVASCNHFLSDASWGAATGWVFAAACLPGGWLSPIFDRLQTWQIARLDAAGR